MRHVQDNAEESVRRVLGALKDGEFSYEMDNGAVIRVKITTGADRRSATIDFTGTSAQLDSNFNAPTAVVYAAALYVFRTLVDADIPLNAGCLKPLQIVIPEGCMLNPRPPAATVAGNVETSQCITDTLYGALGVMAASMRHHEQFHVRRRAISVLRDDFRRNGRRAWLPRLRHGAGPHDQLAPHRSGGVGVALPGAGRGALHPQGQRRTRKWSGGDGATRRIRFLEPMKAPFYPDIAAYRPMAWQAESRADWDAIGWSASVANVSSCPYADEIDMKAGDVFVIETPGGGGYGAPE